MCAGILNYGRVLYIIGRMEDCPKPKSIILSVDDEPHNLELIELYLRNTGFAVRSVNSGAAAISFLESCEDEVALAIVDIMMPDVSGYELCHQMRALEKYRFVPILISSGLSGSSDKAKAMEAGADDFVTKPLDRQTLIIRVKSLVRIGELYRELMLKNRQVEAAMEKLNQAQKMIIENEKYISIVAMAQGMAHEIYNPLTIINGNVERMLIKLKNGAVTDEFLADMARSVKIASARCERIVDSLQTYSSESLNSIESTDMNELVRKVVSIYEPSYLVDHSIVFGEALSEGLPKISCDIQSLSQALMNVIVNARESIGRGGRITVRTTFDNGAVVISVADDGPGFAEDALRRAFDPFYTTKKVGEHSGLGLPMALGILKLHKGGITISNNAGGRGASVSLTVPSDVKIDNNLYNVIF